VRSVSKVTLLCGIKYIDQLVYQFLIDLILQMHLSSVLSLCVLSFLGLLWDYFSNI